MTSVQSRTAYQTTMPNSFRVESDNVTYAADKIVATVDYTTSEVEVTDSVYTVKPRTTAFRFSTDRKVPRTGLMLVGLGGNNGSTLVASLLAHKKNVSWQTKERTMTPNFFGSLTQAATTKLGTGPKGADVFVPFKALLPMVDPLDLVVDGWDISSTNLGDAMKRAKVLDYDLQRQLYDDLKQITPRRSIYLPEFIASNQSSRADNVLDGNKAELVEQIRADLNDFKLKNGLDKVVVLWTANTERFCEVRIGLNDSAENLLAAIKADEAEISPSTLFAVACALEKVTYINGSPQNTFVPGLIELASKKGSFIAGDDFKSGQTKMKSVLVDFLVGAGIKPTSIVSYNHLGNNDGKNLSAPQQFRSKEISKSNVVDDMVASNPILYKPGEHPDHVVVIKYVPYVGDSKRAMDEYTSEIFMGGTNTIVMHNTCEDSLLATPLILDLVIVAELCERITYATNGSETLNKLQPILSLLSYWLKAPLVPAGAPIVNALFAQRAALENLFRACAGLPVETYMGLEHRL